MLNLLIGISLNAPTPTNFTLDIPKPKPAIVKELTIQEKYDTNFYKCDTNTQWIRSDNAQCLDKQTAVEQYPVKTTVQASADNLYTAGQCTWYVKNRRADLPNNLGNANRWYYMAKSDGLATGSIPKVGAVGVSFGGYYGHVVYVESVQSDGSMTISEMNYDYVPFHLRTRAAVASEFVYIY